MKSALVVLLTAGLLLAGAAYAKGPHAVLKSGADPVGSGEHWDVTIEMMETAASSPPTLLARKDERVVTVRGTAAGSEEFMSRYAYDVVLPEAGRWRLAVIQGKRRFEFPAVSVGSGRPPQDYVAFPEGSRAERDGAGGIYFSSGDPVPGDGGPSLPPEEFAVATDDAGGGGVPVWVFPLAGVVLAGAGVLKLRSR